MLLDEKGTCHQWTDFRGDSKRDPPRYSAVHSRFEQAYATAEQAPVKEKVRQKDGGRIGYSVLESHSQHWFRGWQPVQTEEKPMENGELVVTVVGAEGVDHGPRKMKEGLTTRMIERRAAVCRRLPWKTQRKTQYQFLKRVSEIPHERNEENKEKQENKSQ